MRYTHIVNFKQLLSEAETTNEVMSIIEDLGFTIGKFDENEVELDNECSNLDAGYLVFVTEDPVVAAEFPTLLEKEGSIWDDDEDDNTGYNLLDGE